MHLNGVFLWTLSIKKRRYDALLPTTKATIITWWIQETRVNPHRKKVMQKRVVANVFYEKPTQFLMEVQVSGLILTPLFSVICS
jgi:hypothetical protein